MIARLQRAKFGTMTVPRDSKFSRLVEADIT